MISLDRMLYLRIERGFFVIFIEFSVVLGVKLLSVFEKYNRFRIM